MAFSKGVNLKSGKKERSFLFDAVFFENLTFFKETFNF
jgi:hypothetical protein